MSIAGGYYKAVERAAEVGCDCVQVFTKNNNQWRAKELSEEDVRLFRQALDRHPQIQDTLSHASYLINLASPDKELWEKSVAAMVIELQRAHDLGIPYVVFHPGAHIELEAGVPKSKKQTLTEAVERLDEDTPQRRGMQRIVEGLDEIHRRIPGLTSQCLLENTAGQGTNLGWCFEQLGWILQRVESPHRVGVCIDTCHAFAAGYPLATKKAYQATIKALDRAVGIANVRAFHLNDSKRELGSRVDRHESIGLGELGAKPFRHLLNDKRFADRPMYLETPKGDRDDEAWDVINLRVLRDLVETRAG